MKFKTGDRVHFVKNPHRYDIGSNNPIKGSLFFCAGTVTYAAGDGIGVLWDNGTKNGYRAECLTLAENPGHPLTKIFK